MQNPVFSKNSNFVKETNTTPAGYPTMPGYDVNTSYSNENKGYSQSAPSSIDEASRFDKIKDSYYQASADSVDTNRMTYDDVIVKTGIVFALLLVSAAASWYVALNIPSASGIFVVGVIGAFILGIINSFKKEPSPLLISAYSIFEGVALGGISAFFEMRYPGIVSTAVLATLVTFAVCLGLYKTSIVRVNARFKKILIIGLVSYLVFIAVNFLLTIFGVLGAGGLRSVTVAGIPLGIAIGLIAVLLASMSLISDFDFIQKGVESGIPSKYAWTAAFGLLVTLVWLYLEFLRLASYFYDSE
ncbi:Bax inhibitor-1/YccA family protein [Actinomyces sp. zg-332]|uniref:Bax inhibitor-1/YccA family protein n=1 Tax=Actinomyces sp. zg-332 TaxID=2708340 RepID=UPI0014217AC0|nr:Bax inhibitor-1/YccA family protein [Actinomyces sp. zg-332]QPK94714.1 Bax inhibitor-1/YccA family protein [Actinomyces sp. zg-332]